MSERNETHAAVVEEMRNRTDVVGGDMVDNFSLDATFGEYGGYDPLPLIKAYADRAEAAHKREVDALTTKLEVAKHCWKVWSDRADELKNKCNEQYAKLKTVGNAAKMREALDLVDEGFSEGCLDASGDCPTKHDLHRVSVIKEKVKSALAAPARNCDVGTAEEQAKRFDAFCGGKNCLECPHFPDSRCELAWAQTHYEEGGDDADK